MERFRTIPGILVRLLIAAFVIAQLAGVVSARPAQPGSDVAASHIHHHGAPHSEMDAHHHHGGAIDDFGGACCALHAFFSGVLPTVIAIDAAGASGRALTLVPDATRNGVFSSRLERPPRPQR
jgi:hypothetical protein